MKKVLFVTTLLALFAAQGVFVLLAELQVPLAQALWWALIGVVRPAALAINSSPILLLAVLLLAIDLGIAWAVSTALTTDLTKFGLIPLLFWVLIYTFLLFVFLVLAEAGIVNPELRRALWMIGQFIGAATPIPYSWGLPFFFFAVVGLLAVLTAAYQKRALPMIIGLAVGFSTGIVFDERYVLRAAGLGEFWMFGLWLLVPLMVALWTVVGEHYGWVFIYPEKRAFLVGTFSAQFVALTNAITGVFGPRAYPMAAAGAASIALITSLVALVIFWVTFTRAQKVLPKKK